MKKPTFYLWKHEYSSEEEYQKERQEYIDLGYRVVTFIEGPKGKDIHEALKAIVRNHINDV